MGEWPRYVRSGTEQLRCGYTTGSCAAMAASASVRALLLGAFEPQARIIAPDGTTLAADVIDASLDRGALSASCAIRKDAGDDVDATDGIAVYAHVTWTPASADGDGEVVVTIDGGEGVGRVVRPGLDQPVGAAAINRTPRAMIETAVRAACEEMGASGGWQVVVSVPDGVEIARKTFNERLGVVGGISILGTSGIVEPRSVAAYVQSVALELQQAVALGHRGVLLVPGNYGRAFVRASAELRELPCVSFGNYLGEALDVAGTCGLEQVVIVGHVGKLAKVAGGAMNTHSRVADGRRETLCAHAAIAGGSTRLARQLMATTSTEACLDLLDEAGLLAQVCDSVTEAVAAHVRSRAGVRVGIGVILFSQSRGELARSAGTSDLVARMRSNEAMRMS